MSLIIGSAGTSGPSTQARTTTSSASPASGSIWSGSLKQAILLLGGTWPPAGTKITSGPSATAATSQDKDSSGYLVDTSIVSERERLRKLCSVLRRSTVTSPLQCEQPLSITGRKLTVFAHSKASRSSARKAYEKDVRHLQKILQKALSEPMEDEVQRLRIERWAEMVDYAMVDRVDPNEVQRYYNRVGRINLRLWKLTGNEVYREFMYKSRHANDTAQADA